MNGVETSNQRVLAMDRILIYAHFSRFCLRQKEVWNWHSDNNECRVLLGRGDIMYIDDRVSTIQAVLFQYDSSALVSLEFSFQTKKDYPE